MVRPRTVFSCMHNVNTIVIGWRIRIQGLFPVCLSGERFEEFFVRADDPLLTPRGWPLPGIFHCLVRSFDVKCAAYNRASARQTARPLRQSALRSEFQFVTEGQESDNVSGLRACASQGRRKVAGPSSLIGAEETYGQTIDMCFEEPAMKKAKKVRRMKCGTQDVLHSSRRVAQT